MLIYLYTLVGMNTHCQFYKYPIISGRVWKGEGSTNIPTIHPLPVSTMNPWVVSNPGGYMLHE